MKLKFWGATQQVSGSMTLLELDSGIRILVDCGIDLQAYREIKKNSQEEAVKLLSSPIFPAPARDIDVVILTHAHIDHTGCLPILIREGFSGQIFCTTPTRPILELLLKDTSRINETRIKKNKAISKESAEALYTSRFIFNKKEMEGVMTRVNTYNFNETFTVAEDTKVQFISTGHLIGAANVVIYHAGKSIAFSGDIGRKNYPILSDPEPLPQVDALVMESTYGSRMHRSKDKPEDVILPVIEEVCLEKQGRLIIPAFSIGRTQAIIFTIHQLFLQGKIPKIPIYLDTPMGKKSNIIHENYYHLLNKKVQKTKNEHGRAFDFELLKYINHPNANYQLASSNESCIVISASGMIEGGRIQEHVYKKLQDPTCTILMVGYCASHTFGYQLLHHSEENPILWNKKPLNVKAEILQTDVYSGHADQGDLLTFLKTQNPTQLQKLFLVHGERESMNVFKEIAENLGYAHVYTPSKEQVFEI